MNVLERELVELRIRDTYHAIDDIAKAYRQLAMTNAGTAATTAPNETTTAALAAWDRAVLKGLDVFSFFDTGKALADALRAEQAKREAAEADRDRLQRVHEDLVESVIGALRLDEEDALDARANPMPSLPVMVNERANEVLRLQQARDDVRGAGSEEASTGSVPSSAGGSNEALARTPTP